MIIPESFQIAGLTVKVVTDNGAIKREKFIGKSDFSFQQIVMDMTTVPRESTEQAFLHEVVHWILYIQNEHELRMNEKFVDVFAQLLYQVLASGKMLKDTEVDHERYLCPNCVVSVLSQKGPLESLVKKKIHGADREGDEQLQPLAVEDRKQKPARPLYQHRDVHNHGGEDDCLDRCPPLACSSCKGVREGDEKLSHRKGGTEARQLNLAGEG